MEINIICPLCFEICEEPRHLSCGHFICLECSQKLINLSQQQQQQQHQQQHQQHSPNQQNKLNINKSKIICPECFEECQIKINGEDFSENDKIQKISKSFLKSIFQNSPRNFHNNSNEKQNCPNCLHNVSSVLCNDCGPLCSKCSSHIHQLRIFQTHKVNPLTSLSTSSSSSSKLTNTTFPLCFEHKEETKLYCDICRCLVCHFCLLVGNHKDQVSGTPHSCSPVEDAAEKAKQILLSHNTKNNEIINLLNDIQNELTENLKKAESDYEEIKQNISIHFSQLFNGLEVREVQLFAELENASQLHETSLSKRLLRSQQLIEQSSISIEKGKLLLENKELTSFLQIYYHLSNRLSQTQMNSSIAIKMSQHSLSFGFKLPEIQTKFDNEGTFIIEGSKSDTENSISDPKLQKNTPHHTTPVKVPVKVPQKSPQLKSPRSVVTEPMFDDSRRKSKDYGKKTVDVQKLVLALENSKIELIDSSPDQLFVGSEGILRFATTLFDSQNNLCFLSTLPNRLIQQIEQSIWIENSQKIKQVEETSSSIDENNLILKFMPSKEGEYFLVTTFGCKPSSSTTTIAIAQFSVLPNPSPVPTFITPQGQQKGLDVIQKNGHSIIRRSGAGWRVALMEKDISTQQASVFSIVIHVDELSTSEPDPHRICVGLTEPGSTLDKLCPKQLLLTDCIWGIYLGSGKRIHKDKELKIVQGVKGFQTGDSIGMLIEMEKDKGTMSVYKNGKFQALAFRAMPTCLTPMVAMTGAGNQVTVTDFIVGENIFAGGDGNTK